MTWRPWLRTLWDDLGATLWFRSLIGVSVCILLALGVTLLDEATDTASIAFFRIGVSGRRPYQVNERLRTLAAYLHQPPEPLLLAEEDATDRAMQQ